MIGPVRPQRDLVGMNVVAFGRTCPTLMFRRIGVKKDRESRSPTSRTHDSYLHSMCGRKRKISERMIIFGFVPAGAIRRQPMFCSRNKPFDIRTMGVDKQQRNSYAQK